MWSIREIILHNEVTLNDFFWVGQSRKSLESRTHGLTDSSLFYLSINVDAKMELSFRNKTNIAAWQIRSLKIWQEIECFLEGKLVSANFNTG